MKFWHRASKKYSCRRKAVHHQTDFPILRPWIMNTVLSARNILKGFLSQSSLERDPLEVYSSKEISGLGLCVTSLGDIHKGLKAYSSLLKRYALHVSVRKKNVEWSRVEYRIFDKSKNTYHLLIIYCDTKFTNRKHKFFFHINYTKLWINAQMFNIFIYMWEISTFWLICTLHHSILYYTILYYIIIWYIILYFYIYLILYYIIFILYYIILYCIISYHITL